MLQNACLKLPQKEFLLNIPGRARIKLEFLKGNLENCEILTRYLFQIPGVLLATANQHSAKVLIVYDWNKISITEIESKINDVLFKREHRNLDVDEKSAFKGSKVIKANFEFKKVLAPQKFVDSRNSLSSEYYNFNVKALFDGVQGIKSDKPWHTFSVIETEEKLETDIVNGLSLSEAEEKLKLFGFNELTKSKKMSVITFLLKQFDGFIIKLLLGAAGLSLLLGQVVDALTILAIIGVEAVLGTWQEYKSEKSLNSLREISATYAKVLRNGIKTEVPVQTIVPGDIITLEAGDIVPADARIIESHGLELIEASLTGETFSTYKKNIDIPLRNMPLGDRTNMVFMSTAVVKGNGKAIVVNTGMNTEMGKIAGMLGEVKIEKTPLQKDLHNLSKFISWGCLGICAVITIGGILSGSPLIEMFATGVSLAVGAIPEGLTTVLAISLAFGAQRLVKKKAIVKSLPAMETLSCTKVICTDKTGTLTKNEMTVKEIYVLDKFIKVTGEGYNSQGQLLLSDQSLRIEAHKDIKMLLTSATLCNNAEIKPVGSSNYKIKGDPTEAALIIAAAKAGLKPTEFDCYKREHEIPFDPETKKMVAICSDTEGRYFAFTKGATDIILDKCTKIMSNGSSHSITEEQKQQLHIINDNMADKALRVLALAYKPLESAPVTFQDQSIEEDMIFLGFVGIMDPPRPEVPGAIKKCLAAGIKVVMITGDHKKTAIAVAKSIGLLSQQGIVLTGSEIEEMGEPELAQIINKVDVFARTCPAQKLKIVKAFKNKGLIVAMTGDGVNDAPALKEAHIGIAMGKSGADVTKDVAAIILTDDNFNTVVKAVEEGRTINRNIKKFIKYVLAGNFAEVFTIFVASILRMPTPLIPVQILMLNLITEGIPALSLGVDPPEVDIMEEPPRNPEESIFSSKIKNRIITRGVITGLATLGIFRGTLFFTGNLMRARTMAFANLVSYQMLHAFECSSMGIKRNKYLLPSVLISSGITLASIYIPALRGVFKMAPLNLLNWSAIAVSAFVLSRIDGFLKGVIFLAKNQQKSAFIV